MKRAFVLLAVVGLAAPALAGLLFDNGPFVTGVGNGFNGANTSAIETGYSTYGYGINNTIPYRIADDFTVPGGGWTLSNMHYFGYQTGSTTTPTFTGAYVTIYNGDPSLGGAPIAGDYTTNRILTGTTVWSGVYRVSTDPLNNQRPIMAIDVDMAWAPPLAAGTYWIGVSLTGSLGSGPWANPAVPHRPSDNALQYVSPTWNRIGAADGLIADFPFQLYGVPEPASLMLLGLGALVLRRR